MVATNLTTQKTIAGDLEVAKSLFARIKGLLGKNSLETGGGLWITPCKGIHTFGMRFPIDVLVLNNNKVVIAVRRNMPPNCMTSIYPRAANVLELPTGTIEASATEIGHQIEIL